VKRLSVLMAVAFIDMIGLMMVLPLMPLYAKSLNATPTMVGLLASSFSIAQLASSPIWGRVSDRRGRRPVLLVGLTASAIAYVVFGFASALWLLFVSRFVQGLGGGTTGVAQAYVADTMAPQERAKALGWLSAATSAGVIIGPAIGSLAAGFGQAGPGLLAASLCIVNVVFAWRWLPESRFQGQTKTPSGHFVPQPEPRPVRDAFWEVIRHPGRPVARMIWIYAVAMLAYNATPPIFALYLSWRFGITARNIGYFFLVFGVVGVVMRAVVVGWVNDKLGEIRTMRVGAVLYGLGYALITLAATVPQFLMVQVLLPLGTALLFPANSALVSHHASKHEFGLMLGVQQALRGVASVIAPTLAGFAYQHLGPSVPFIGCSVIIGFALLLAVRVPQPSLDPAAATAV